MSDIHRNNTALSGQKNKQPKTLISDFDSYVGLPLDGGTVWLDLQSHPVGRSERVGLLSRLLSKGKATQVHEGHFQENRTQLFKKGTITLELRKTTLFFYHTTILKFLQSVELLSSSCST